MAKPAYYGRAYWHIHHETLMEFATEPIQNRIEHIKLNKPASEHATRLRLLKPVKGKLPVAVTQARDKAIAARAKADAARDKAIAARDKAIAARDKADADLALIISDNMPAIEALHKRECKHCPWDGKTIFP